MKLTLKILLIIVALSSLYLLLAGRRAKPEDKKMKTDIKLNTLTPEEKHIIIDKGTERPFTGKYTDTFKPGLYICRQCNAPLYRDDDKFKSSCGWPAFDDAIKGAVKQTLDADGRRTEITCNKCGGHLGHVFVGEQLTQKNTRHCVNSLSMKLEPSDTGRIRRAFFAGGCFWGVEYQMKKADGVLVVTSGYIDGKTQYPTYKEVCTHTTGHTEAVEVIFDSKKTDFETLAKLFFEIHDPTQLKRQGPDIGSNYRSGIYYLSNEQKKVTEKLVKQLKEKGLNVVTEIKPAPRFWPAEDYHQDYHERHGSAPVCHRRVKRF